MQPTQDPTDWKQPQQQPSQAPYVAQPEEPALDVQPVVTMKPDQPIAPPSPSESPVSEPSSSSVQEPVRWQAVEYIHREKNALWYVIFGLVFIVLMAISIFLIKSITFDILVPVMAIALLVYANRPPRVIDYTLSRQGLHINDELHAFGNFKGFGVVHGDDEYSIILLPTKRFKPGVSVYFPEEAGEAIVDMLGARLPMQELHLDFVDRLIRKLRI